MNKEHGFFRWFLGQVDSNDEIGRLACDLIDDENFDESCDYTVAELESYLGSAIDTGSDDVEVLQEAHLEWEFERFQNNQVEILKKKRINNKGFRLKYMS